MRIEPACSESGPNASRKETHASGPGETKGPPFPSARYFQIHFEHIEALLDRARQGLEALRAELAACQGQAAAASATPEQAGPRRPASAGTPLSLRIEATPRKPRRQSAAPGDPARDWVARE